MRRCVTESASKCHLLLSMLYTRLSKPQEKGKSLKKALDKKHNVNLLRRNVQGAMVYMVKKGILEKKKEERGLFSLKSEIVVEKT